MQKIKILTPFYESEIFENRDNMKVKNTKGEECQCKDEILAKRKKHNEIYIGKYFSRIIALLCATLLINF